MSDVLICIVGILGIINLLVTLVVTVVLCCEYDNNPPVLFQQHLWLILDDYGINFTGKLLLCVLTVPFTVFYTVVTLMYYTGFFVCSTAWKLFCLAFKKH